MIDSLNCGSIKFKTTDKDLLLLIFSIGINREFICSLENDELTLDYFSWKVLGSNIGYFLRSKNNYLNLLGIEDKTAI